MSALAVNNRLPSGIEMDEKASDEPISITGDLMEKNISSSTVKHKTLFATFLVHEERSDPGTTFEASTYEAPLNKRGHEGQVGTAVGTEN